METPGRCSDWLDTATVTAQGPSSATTRRGTGDSHQATREDLTWPPAGTATWPSPGTFSWPRTRDRPHHPRTPRPQGNRQRRGSAGGRPVGFNKAKYKQRRRTRLQPAQTVARPGQPLRQTRPQLPRRAHLRRPTDLAPMIRQTRSSPGCYLVTCCRLRGSARGFRLDRITAAELLAEVAPARPNTPLLRPRPAGSRGPIGARCAIAGHRGRGPAECPLPAPGARTRPGRGRTRPGPGVPAPIRRV